MNAATMERIEFEVSVLYAALSIVFLFFLFAIIGMLWGALNERKLQVGYTIKTEKEARKYGHPVGSVLVSKMDGSQVWREPCSYYVPYGIENRKNEAKDLTFVEQKDDMKPRAVFINAQKWLWFHPQTKKDGQGRQFGYLLDNPYGIAVKKTWEAGK